MLSDPNGTRGMAQSGTSSRLVSLAVGAEIHSGSAILFPGEDLGLPCLLR